MKRRYGFGVVFLALIFLFVFPATALAAGTDSPQAAFQQFCTDVSSNGASAAYADMDAEYQQSHDQNEFATEISEYYGDYCQVEDNIQSQQGVYQGTADFTVYDPYSPNNQKIEQVHLVAVQERGAYYISSLNGDTSENLPSTSNQGQGGAPSQYPDVQGTAQSFCNNVTIYDWPSAYEYTTQAYQSSNDITSFQQQIEGRENNFYTACSISSITQQSDGGMSISISWTTGQYKTIPQTVTMVSESGTWKVNQIIPMN